MALYSAGVFVLGLLAQPAVSRAPQAQGMLSAPAGSGKPVEVAIGFYAYDFARVTPRDESFDLTGYLELSWRDPRLELPAADRAATKELRRMDAARVWTPKVYFENALEQPRQHADPVIEVDPDGMITSWSIVSGKFSSTLHLERFPFDRQRLAVRIGAFEDESIMKFQVKNELVLLGEDAFLTDWTIVNPEARIDSHRFVPGQAVYPRFTYEVEINRRATFYVWRVMVPLFFLALVPWAAFWFEPVGLQPQISTCLASLIALVTFNFAIDFSLPKVVYLTLIDKHALIGFAFVVLSVAAVTVIHLAVTNNRLQQALAIQRVVRWIYLPAYLLAVLMNLGVLIG
jgi:hypothetical protein